MLRLLAVDTALTGLEGFGSVGRGFAADRPAVRRHEKTREVRGHGEQETFWWWTQSVSHPSQASNTLLTGNYQGKLRNLPEEMAIQLQKAWILQELGGKFPDVKNREFEIQNRERKRPLQRIRRRVAPLATVPPSR